jgi:hypothetical protein
MPGGVAGCKNNGTVMEDFLLLLGYCPAFLSALGLMLENGLLRLFTMI